MARTIEQQLDTRELRRCGYEAKACAKMDRRFEAAEKMLGEVIRNGKAVYYVFPVGGKYREGNWSELIDFLLRNNYV